MGGPVELADLLSLRDIGGLSLSPDRSWLAFQLRQADLATNAYVLRWFVMPADGSGAPKPIAFDGGQPIRYVTPAGLPDGYLPPERARWSPDSRHLAVRRQVEDRIELWRLTPSTGAAHRVADGVRQVTELDWASNGALVFRTGLDTNGFKKATEDEVRRGWRLDARMPLLAAREPSPIPPICTPASTSPFCENRVWSADADGVVRPATADEAQALVHIRPQIAAARAQDVGFVGDPAPDGAKVWTEASPPGPGAVPPRRLMTDRAGSRPCAADACVGQFIMAAGWTQDSSAIWFLKRIASVPRAALDRIAIYRWRPATGQVSEVLRTDDLIEDCQARAAELVCARSRAGQPRHVAAINLETGGIRVLADPNPAITTKQLPKVRQLPLMDPYGAPGFARLVYPLDYQPGRRYPLVVTLYRSRGFLRGSAPGDEIPIYPLSARGFFVLSVDKPDDLEAWTLYNEAEIGRRDRDNHRGLRSLVGAVESALDGLAQEGLIDPARVGVTGLSWGAQSVHFALQHSDHFSVAIASQGAADLTYFAQLPSGPIREAAMAMMKSSTLIPEGDSYLARTGWSQQPERLRSPLLLNLGQYEALFGFEGFMALQAANRPLEVRVFPDETHNKLHPQNLLGVWENNLHWLGFWLQGAEDSDPAYAEDYVRWRDMRDRLRTATASLASAQERDRSGR